MNAGQYWQIRALSEQRDKEMLQGTVAGLRAQIEAARTATRLERLMTELHIEGVIDLTVGEWAPDDERETFVRVDQSSQDAPVTPEPAEDPRGQDAGK